MSVTPIIGKVIKDGRDGGAVHELVDDGTLDEKKIKFFGSFEGKTISKIKRYLVWVETAFETSSKYSLDLPDKEIEVTKYLCTSALPGLIAYEVISEFEKTK